MAHHAVATHGGQHHHVGIRKFLDLALEAQPISDAVPRNAGGVAALLGAVDGSRDIDAYAEVGFLDSLDESLGRDAIVENGGDCAGWIETVDDSFKIGRRVTVPVGGRIHMTAGAESSAVDRITKVDGLKWNRHFQELSQLG